MYFIEPSFESRSYVRDLVPGFTDSQLQQAYERDFLDVSTTQRDNEGPRPPKRPRISDQDEIGSRIDHGHGLVARLSRLLGVQDLHNLADLPEIAM